MTPETETIDPLGVKAILQLPQVISTDQLDITSHFFKPELFLNKVHGRITQQELKLGLKNLQASHSAV